MWRAVVPVFARRTTLNDMAKNIILWVVIAMVLMTVFNNFTNPKKSAPAISYSHFLEQVNQRNVSKVEIHKDGKIVGITGNGSRFTTNAPNDEGLVSDLLNNNVEIIAKPPEQPSLLWRS